MNTSSELNLLTSFEIGDTISRIETSASTIFKFEIDEKQECGTGELRLTDTDRDKALDIYIERAEDGSVKNAEVWQVGLNKKDTRRGEGICLGSITEIHP